MKLNVLIKNEEKLLIFDSNNKFDIDFNEYVRLNNLLREIGNITSNYFILMKEYDNKIKVDKQGDERKKMLIDFNNKLLDTDIYINECEIKYFIDKYRL